MQHPSEPLMASTAASKPREATASTINPRFEVFRHLPPELRSKVYGVTLTGFELTFPRDFEVDGKISHSRFSGFALLDALADSEDWHEDHKLATKMAWSSVTLHFSIYEPQTMIANRKFFDQVMNNVIDANPVKHIKRLRFKSLNEMLYLLSYRGSPLDWRQRLTGVETIEVFCNHPMLPSAKDEAKVYSVLLMELMNASYMGFAALSVETVTTFLCADLPALKQVQIKNSRRCYTLSFTPKGLFGHTKFVLEGVESIEQVEEPDTDSASCGNTCM